MYKKPGEGIMPAREITVSGFHTKGQALSWDFKVYEPGSYDVAVVCHLNKRRSWESDGKMRVYVAGQSIENQLIEHKSAESIAMPNSVKVYSNLGTVKLDNPGTHSLTLEVSADFTTAKPRLYGVVLIPTNSLKK